MRKFSSFILFSILFALPLQARISDADFKNITAAHKQIYAEKNSGALPSYCRIGDDYQGKDVLVTTDQELKNDKATITQIISANPELTLLLDVGHDQGNVAEGILSIKNSNLPSTVTKLLISNTKNNVTTIGNEFLYCCQGLTRLDLSPLSNVTQIESCFLYGCEGLSRLDLSPLSNVTRIRDHFLSNCVSLTRLDLSPLSNVIGIRDGFIQQNNFIEIILPESDFKETFAKMIIRFLDFTKETHILLAKKLVTQCHNAIYKHLAKENSALNFTPLSEKTNFAPVDLYDNETGPLEGEALIAHLELCFNRNGQLNQPLITEDERNVYIQKIIPLIRETYTYEKFDFVDNHPPFRTANEQDIEETKIFPLFKARNALMARRHKPEKCVYTNESHHLIFRNFILVLTSLRENKDYDSIQTYLKAAAYYAEHHEDSLTEALQMTFENVGDLENILFALVYLAERESFSEEATNKKALKSQQDFLNILSKMQNQKFLQGYLDIFTAEKLVEVLMEKNILLLFSLEQQAKLAGVETVEGKGSAEILKLMLKAQGILK